MTTEHRRNSRDHAEYVVMTHCPFCDEEFRSGNHRINHLSEDCEEKP